MQVGAVGVVDEHKDVDDNVLSRFYRWSHLREHVRVAHGRLPRLAAPLRLEMLVRHRSCVVYTLNTNKQKGQINEETETDNQI